MCESAAAVSIALFRRSIAGWCSWKRQAIVGGPRWDSRDWPVALRKTCNRRDLISGHDTWPACRGGGNSSLFSTSSPSSSG
jgi:hypothetical protein